MFPKCNAQGGVYNTGEGMANRRCEGALVPVTCAPDGWSRGASGNTFEWKITWQCTDCGRKFPL